MHQIRTALYTSILLAVTAGVTGCSDTWEGLKKDTNENVQAVENAVSQDKK
ncbi:MAG: hypothetical protein ABJN40_19780 [Sneathiella sp.]